MMLWNIIKNDIYRGIIKRKYHFLFFVAVIIVLVMTVDFDLAKKISSVKNTGNVSTGDLYMIFYKGSPLFDSEGVKDIYISEQYIFMIICMMLCIGSYYSKDFNGVGLQIILRCRNVRSWFAGKIVLCFISNIIIHLCLAAAVIFVSCIHGYDMSMEVNSKLLRLYGYSGSPAENSACGIFVLSVVLPFLSLLAMAVLQMVISIIASPVTGVLATAAAMTASVFSNSGLMILNGLMLRRNDVFIPGGVNTFCLVMVDLTVIICSCTVGYCYLWCVDKMGNRE